MNPIFEQFISEPRQASFRPVSPYSSQIAKEAALQDLEELIYLLDNRYCGRDYWQRQGISFEDCYREIAAFIGSQEEIYISDFCRAIHRAFNKGIVDNHLAFCSPMTGRLGFSKQYHAYFTDIAVELRGDHYIVVASDSDKVKLGDTVSDKEKLFPTLSPTDAPRFLVGCRSFDPVQTIVVTVNGALATLPVHRCRAGIGDRGQDTCMAEYKKNGIRVLQSNCCDYVGRLTEETDLAAIGRSFCGEERFLLNYLDNEGGYNRITREFIQGLNGYVHCQEDSMILRSPVTEQKDCERKWFSLSEAREYEREKGTYDGTMYMLVNSATASSGESAVLYARSLKNLVLIGENTMGCNTFGNVASYELTHSKIVCRIPNVINLCADADECKEGYGFTPDYWVDSSDVEGEVLKWLNR